MATGVLQEVEVQWAKVQEPGERSGKYEIECVKLTPEKIKYISSFNQGVKGIAHTKVRNDPEKPEKGSYIKFKSKDKPALVDALKNPLPMDTLIGNGSICNIVFRTSDFTGEFSGRTLKLEAVQVIKLVSYTAKSNPLDALPDQGDSEKLVEVN